MNPPWKVFPELARGSIGWRMGAGEDCYNQFYKWFSALDANDQDRYREANAEPAGWEGFYETIVEHPWRD